MFRNDFLSHRSGQSGKEVQSAKGSTKTLNDRSITEGQDVGVMICIVCVSFLFPVFFTVNYVTIG